MSLRVVLTTNDSFHGRGLVETFHRRRIRLHAVLVQTGSFGPPWRPGLTPVRRLAAWPRSLAGTLLRTWRFHRRQRPFYGPRAAAVRATGFMNSPRLVRDLRRLEPDFVVWGGGGILQPQVIETARLGVLNVHPALLPWVRGCGVVGHSLASGVAAGATVHYIDRGIDTGAVVERRLAPVSNGALTLGAVEEASYRLAWEMMADVVEGIVSRGEIPSGVAQQVRYPLFRWSDAAGIAAHDALAVAGRAGELFRQWNPLCVECERWTLPPGDVAAPPSLGLRPL